MGYSSGLSKVFSKPDEPFQVLTPKPFLQYVYNREKREFTDQISCYKYWFLQPGFAPIEVRFKKPLDLDESDDEIYIINLETFKKSSNGQGPTVYYHRADGINYGS